MNEQEEYVEKTKRLLKSYNALRVTLANQEARIQLKKYELRLGEAAPISKYGDAPRGGSQELNAVEKAAARRITIEETIGRLQAEAQKTRYAIDTVDRCLRALPTDEQALVREHYFDCLDWRSIGESRHYSERWARQRGHEVVERIARMIFWGVQQMELDFLLEE